MLPHQRDIGRLRGGQCQRPHVLGLEDEKPIGGLNTNSRAVIPGLLENDDRVWHW